MKTQKIKREPFLSKHRYAIGIFAFIFLYNFVFVSKCSFRLADGYAYAFHLLDFSIGFHTGVLPGAVFWGLFKNHISQMALTIYLLTLISVVMLTLSFLLESVIKTAVANKMPNVVILVLLFVVGPFTVTDCFLWMGYLDMYLFLLSVLFFVCVENRFLIWFIPILFVVAVMIHFSSFLTCIPMFTIVLLFKSVQGKNASRMFGRVLVISLLLAIALGLYLALFEPSNMNLTLEQLHTLLADRGGEPYKEEFADYFDYLFYKTYHGIDFNVAKETLGATASETLLRFVKHIQFNYSLMRTRSTSEVFLEVAKIIVAIPLFLGYYCTIIGFVRKKSNPRPTIKTILLLTLLQLPIAGVAILFSIDIARWPIHAVTILSAEMLFFVSNDYSFMEYVNCLIERNRPLVLSCLFITATTVI